MPPRAPARYRLSTLAALLVMASVGPSGAAAQSVTDSRVAGTVRTALGEPISRPQVIARAPDGTRLRSVEGRLDGAFVLRGLPPGSYSIRVEALGYAPRVYFPVAVLPGVDVDLDVILNGAGAPVDTVAARSAAPAPAPGLWLDRSSFGALPRPTPGLEDWARLSTYVGDGLAMEGLPGQHTRLFVDGFAFRPVRPLGVRSLDRATGFLTARTLAAVEVSTGPVAAELQSGAGGAVSAHSRRATGSWVAVDGAASTGPLRSAATDPDDAPGTLSLWAGGAASIVVTPDTAGLMVGADVWQTERPRSALLPSASGDEEGVGAPYVEQRRAAAGFVRFDRALGDDGLVWATGRFGLRPATTDLAGMAYGMGDAGERVDALAGIGATIPVGRREIVDARLSVTRSAWTAPAESGVEFPFEVEALTALDPATNLRIGPGAQDLGTASRLDLALDGSVQLDRGAHRIRLGASGGLARHEQDFGRIARGVQIVGTGSPTALWSGVADAQRFTGRESTTVPRVTVFGQEAWSVSPGFIFDVGVAVDWEWLPSDVPAAGEWFVATGVVESEYQSRVLRGSGFLGLRWTGPSGSSLRARASYVSEEADPSLLMELMASQRNQAIRLPVSGAAWPSVPGVVANPPRPLTSLAYLLSAVRGPEATRFEGAFGQAVGRALFEVSGVYRFTRGLLRRRDLNRAAAPRGVDGNGRPLWGEPARIGSWVGAAPDGIGRFDAFGPVWELDLGGWSEYAGATARFEVGEPDGLRLSAEYTWSTTTDNVPGLGTNDLLAGASFETADPDENPSEGTSDFDRPHLASATLAWPLPVGEGSLLSAVYRFESGAPYTAGYAAGIDANMDGILGNDPAFVSNAASTAVEDGDCLDGDAGGFATRNGCRAPAVHTLDLRLALDLPRVDVQVFVDALNVLDRKVSLLDHALWVGDPSAELTSNGTTTTLPFAINPNFGAPLRDLSPGRMLRVGVRVGR